ncbi:MAG: VPLPA-CTERM sorting domain-containing protein [Pseudooceanicola sp.]
MLFRTRPTPILGAVLLGAFAILPHQAAADCSGGPIYTCTGTDDTDGLIDNADDVAVTVVGGATVTNTTRANADDPTLGIEGDDSSLAVQATGKVGSETTAVLAKDGFVMVNDGEISAADDAVIADDDVTITNNGVITAKGLTTDTGFGIDVDNDSTVINNGTIASTAIDADTVDVGKDSTVTNNAGAIITATDRAVDMNDRSTLENHGTITAGGEGVETGDGATIRNHATGLIEAVDDALNPGQDVTVHNWGIIRNVAGQGDEAQDAIDLDSGAIHNHAGAEISSTRDAAIDFDAGNGTQSLIDNAGRIAGEYAVMVELGGGSDPANVDSQKIVNRTGAELTGRSGTAAILGLGNDEVELHAGSTLNGALDLGGDDDKLTFFGNTSIDGAYGIFDGGDGQDGAVFDGAFLADLAGVTGTADNLFLTFLGDSRTEYTYNFVNFELFDFGANGTYRQYASDQIAALAQVPLPAGALLLGAALGGLGMARRRR